MRNDVLSKDSQIYRDTYCCAKEMERLTTTEMIEIKMHEAVDMMKKYLTERLPCSQYLTSKS